MVPSDFQEVKADIDRLIAQSKRVISSGEYEEGEQLLVDMAHIIKHNTSVLEKQPAYLKQARHHQKKYSSLAANGMRGKAMMNQITNNISYADTVAQFKTTVPVMPELPATQAPTSTYEPEPPRAIPSAETTPAYPPTSGYEPVSVSAPPMASSIPAPPYTPTNAYELAPSPPTSAAPAVPTAPTPTLVPISTLPALTQAPAPIPTPTPTLPALTQAPATQAPAQIQIHTSTPEVAPSVPAIGFPGLPTGAAPAIPSLPAGFPGMPTGAAPDIPSLPAGFEGAAANPMIAQMLQNPALAKHPALAGFAAAYAAHSPTDQVSPSIPTTTTRGDVVTSLTGEQTSQEVLSTPAVPAQPERTQITRAANPYLESPAAIPGVSNPYVAIAASNTALVNHPTFAQLMAKTGVTLDKIARAVTP